MFRRGSAPGRKVKIDLVQEIKGVKMITRHKTANLFSAMLVIAFLALPFDLPADSHLAAQAHEEAEPPFFLSWLTQDAVPGPAQPPALPFTQQT